MDLCVRSDEQETAIQYALNLDPPQGVQRIYRPVIVYRPVIDRSLDAKREGVKQRMRGNPIARKNREPNIASGSSFRVPSGKNRRNHTNNTKGQNRATTHYTRNQASIQKRMVRHRFRATRVSKWRLEAGTR